MEMQQCGRCRGWKILDDYSPSYRGTPGTWCRACFAEYNRFRKRGLQAPAGKPPTVEPAPCEHCGVVFTPKQARVAKYCSRACKNDAKDAARQKAIIDAKPDRSCAWCGTAMAKTMRSDAKYCTAECNEQAHRRTRAYRRRAGADAPAKPRKQPLVRLIDLAQRDKFICALCGKRVDLSLKYPDPLFATVDHVVPLALGGDPLDPANCRVVHLSCNSKRQHRGDLEQLRMI